MAAEEVVRLLSEQAVPFAEVSAHRASLEQAYLDLTRDAVEYRAEPAREAGRGAACIPRVPLGPGGEAVTDSYYLVSQPLAGDGSITVRVTSLSGRYSPGGMAAGPDPEAGFTPGIQPWSKAGIIISAAARPGAAYAAMLVTGGHGVRMQEDYTGDTPGLAGPVSAASPRWLRLTRSGDTLTGYDSADGRHWARVGSADLAGLPAVVRAGLFAASPDHVRVVSRSLGGGTSLATGAFDHVRLSGRAGGGRWRGAVIGGSPGGLPAAASGFTEAGGAFTVTGTGDIAPLTAGSAGSDTAAIGQYLAGAFAALIAVIVVAVLFITAEYRRGLIRVTLAASPRRGRVLAAKAVVAGGAAFTAGLAGSAVLVPVAARLARAKGAYVLPVTGLTDLRVMAGTGAVLALAAVLAVALGAAARRSAPAVTAGIVVTVLPYILGTAAIFPGGAERWLLRVSPAAALAVQQSVPQYGQVTASYTPMAGYYPLPPWAGLAVLAGYAALALALAGYLLRRRDA